MPPENDQSFPFLTRKMLAFEYAVAFALKVDVQADEAVTLNLRGMTREATFEYKVTTLSNSTISTQTFNLSDIPVMVTIEDTARALEQGQCFVSISLLANGVVIQQLTSGYIYAQKALSWPNTQQVDLRPEGGRLTTIISANPAAGLSAEMIVPTGEIWKVLSAEIVLVTSATVASRRVFIDFIQPSGSLIECFSSIDQLLSTTRAYSMAHYGGVPDETHDIEVLINIPSPVIVGAGGTVAIGAYSMQAADNFTSANLVIEKFFTTP